MPGAHWPANLSIQGSESFSYIPPDHNGLKLEINSWRKKKEREEMSPNSSTKLALA